MALASDPSASRLLTGRAAPEPAPRTLRAGPVSALLDGADLRHIRIGDVELVQRVYVAVRDAPWNTIPATFDQWSVEQRTSSFQVTFHARHRHEAIDFEWRGRIEGADDGTIRYELDGTCHGVFQYSKIGFNVHHALAGSVGRPYVARTEAGELRGTLPEAIDPQRISGTTLTGMFDPYRELAIEVVPGLEAVVALEGDLLELQDHRNWTDANFKSYGTPLALGFPFDSTDGQRIRQVLTISSRGTVPQAKAPAPPTIAIGGIVAHRMPRIGFGQASHDEPLSTDEAARIAALRPAHLRVDVSLTDDGFAALERAATDARAVGAELELAVFANDGSAERLAGLAERLRTIDVGIARVLVYLASDGFSALSGLTPSSVVRLVRDWLEPVTGPVPFAGGTNQSFADINRDRPTDDAYTGICFSISPTVHAVDDASILENVDGQGEVVRSARAFGGGRPISISPVTFATRFGPYPGGPSGPDDLPAPVDVRQASLLGAAWVVGSLDALATSGADSVTYFETTGWRGVVERDKGSPDARFPSRPGDTFPMAHVFADVAERAGARVRSARSDQPLAAVALALEGAAGLRVLVANVTPDAATVVVAGLPDGEVAIRTLDATTAEHAMRDPSAFRTGGSRATVAGGRLRLQLGGYAIATIDAGGG